MRLGEILVRRGHLTPDGVEKGLRQQKEAGGRLGEILVASGAVSEAAVLEALAEEFGCDVVSSIGDQLLDPSLVADLPVEWARTNGLLPVPWEGGTGVLTSDPTVLQALEDLGLMLGRELVPVLAPRAEILRAIERCYFRRKDSAQELIRGLDAGQPAPAPGGLSDDLLRVADQAPVTQLVNVILLEAVKARASDVHIEPFQDALRVRYRIDGMLYEQATPPKRLEAGLVSRLKVMARLDIAEKRLPQDGSARVRVGQREIDVRVSTIPVAEGERVVLRLLDRDSALLPLTDLGMPADVLGRFRTVIREPHGVVLVTGPTGSGKTTTLYASLRELDTGHMNVLTVEEPIEYELAGIGQMQVKPKIGLTFAQGLRHILRQDPDVILVGEIRDRETAEIVVRAALTGHLVFSTLHTNDATGAVVRMLEMGVEPYLVAPAIRAALAQRLVRVLCPACRRAGSQVGDEDTAALGEAGKRLVGRKTWRAEGCPKCLGGYRGRTGIYELMVAGGEVQEAIRNASGAAELRKMLVSHGMRTLGDDAVDKVLQGVTSLAEVLRAVGHAGADGGA